MAHYMPPAIMAFFRPPPPLPFKDPLEKKKMPAYSGIAQVARPRAREAAALARARARRVHSGSTASRTQCRSPSSKRRRKSSARRARRGRM